MGKYSRLGKNTLLVFVGTGGSRIIGLLMLPFYTRWLSLGDYGTTDIINVYVALLLGLATGCISDSVFVFPKGQPVEKQKYYFSSGLFFSFISLIITAVLFELAGMIFEYNSISNSFTANIWLIYGLLVTTFLQRYIQQFTRSIDKMVVYSISGVVLTAGTALFSFLIIPRWGVYGYVMAMILANLSAAIYSLLFSKAFKYINIKAIRKAECVEMLKYSLPLVPNSIMWWLVNALNRPIMESLSGMDSIGIFAVANKFPGMVAIIFSVFAASWQISVLEEFGKEGYSKFYNKMFRLVVFGLMLMFFMIAAGSKLLVTIFTTADFYEAWKYIPVLTLGVVFSNISSFTGCNFSATKESKYFFYSSIYGSLLAIILNFLLIPLWGVMGAALSVLLSFSGMAISRIIYSSKYVKIKNIGIYLLMLLIGILTIMVLLNVQTVWLKNILTLLLFFGFLYINRELKGDFVKLYLKTKSRLCGMR